MKLFIGPLTDKVSLRCDYCKATTSYDLQDLTETRKKATSNGWIYSSGFDWCPSHDSDMYAQRRRKSS